VRTVGLFILVLSVAAGCSRPSRANIELRKRNQALESRINDLERQLHAAEARIAGLEQNREAAFPQKQLDAMFTAHELKLGRLTGSADLDPNRPGDEGLKVYLMPVDELGSALRSTGRVTITVYDLNGPEAGQVGRWVLEPEQLKKLWRGLGALQAFVFEQPWQTVPKHSMLTLRVEFVDGLTGRKLTCLQEIPVKLADPIPGQATVPAR
jgi:hypothetical protein